MVMKKRMKRKSHQNHASIGPREGEVPNLTFLENEIDPAPESKATKERDKKVRGLNPHQKWLDAVKFVCLFLYLLKRVEERKKRRKQK
jgi:hypothetical protein